MQSGEVTLESGNTLRDSITEYQTKAKNAEIDHLTQVLGLDETKLRSLMNSGSSDSTINEYGHFDVLNDRGGSAGVGKSSFESITLIFHL